MAAGPPRPETPEEPLSWEGPLPAERPQAGLPGGVSGGCDRQPGRAQGGRLSSCRSVVLSSCRSGHVW